MNKKVLFLCHSYNNYQKDSIDATSKYFGNLSVLVRYNPIAEISRYLPIPNLSIRNLDYKLDFAKKPQNLDLFLTPVLYAPFNSQYKKLGDKHLRAAEKVLKVNNIEFDLVHAHFSWSAGYVGAKLKEKHCVPFVVTVHGYDIYDFPFRDKEWKEKIEYVLNSADCIITVSNSNSECIKKLDVKTPVKVLPNGFRGDLFFPQNPDKCRKTLNLPVDKQIILSVGDLAVVKGHKYLIDAVGKIVKYRKNVLCVIVGGGELRNKLKKQINAAGLEDYVKLVGLKQHDEIPLWMNACDLFVVPSLRESFGVVQIEAMACGRPVVATRNGGSEEVITSEDCGMIVEPANSSELAKKIELALEKNWCSETITNYSRNFLWENIAEEIYGIYDNLI